MKNLYKHFPREIGVPWRLFAQNKREMLRMINRYNGIKTVYYSLYDCGNNKNYDLCQLDKIHFDFDNHDAINCVEKLHKHCLKIDIKHLMIFSGNHFQFYIFSKNYDNIINRKGCLRNVQEKIAKDSELTIGNPTEIGDIDFHLIGDIARLVRFPNTMHLLTGLYCIPITEEDLEKGEKYIREKSRKQCFDFKYYGTEYIDLRPFDCNNVVDNILLSLSNDIKSKISVDNLLKTFPPCIANMLCSDYVGWRARFHVIVYLRERGYSIKDTYQVLEKYLKGKIHPTNGYDNFHHCIEEEKQVQRIYNTDNYFFSCEKIRNEGQCVEGCNHKVYL